MTLREGDAALVGYAQVCGQLTDEEGGQAAVRLDNMVDTLHRDESYLGIFKRTGIGDIRFMGKIGPIAKVLNRSDDAHNLKTSVWTHFIDLNLSRKQAHHVLRLHTLAVNQFVLAICMI